MNIENLSPYEKHRQQLLKEMEEEFSIITKRRALAFTENFNPAHKDLRLAHHLIFHSFTSVA